MTARVLVADDDRAIRESLSRVLELEGYEVVPAADGVEVLTTLRRARVELLVLDVMMPGVDGLGVCRVLRGQGDRTPILMLTARTGTPDRVAGLDAGADDYLVKPFEVDELLARLRALLRRARTPDTADSLDTPDTAVAAGGEAGPASGARPPARGEPVAARPGPVPAGGVLTIGDVRLDPPARRVWRGGEEVELSRTEFDLLELLMRNADIVLDHGTIYDRIWGYDFGPESKNLAVYVGYLRRKLARPGAAELIRTVRGVGYTIRRP